MLFSTPRFAAGLIAAISLLGGCSLGQAPVATTSLGVQPAMNARLSESMRSDSGLTPLLYVAQPSANTVLIYKQAGTGQNPIGKLTSSLSGPEGVFVNGNHDLYVTNFNSGTIVIFKRGAKAPYKTLTDPGQEPESPVVDAAGTVYVTNFQTTSQGPGSVSVYAHGSTTPTSTLTVPNNLQVLWCALDNHHDLYVGYFSTSGPALGKFKNATGNLAAVNATFQFPGALEFDSTQDLILADETAAAINIYELPAPTPAKVISAPSGGSVVGVALDKQSKVVFLSDTSTAAVYEFSYPSGTLIDTITKGLNTTTRYPTGIATDPSPPL